MTEYKIHDNRGRPFKIIIDNLSNLVKIYRQVKDCNNCNKMKYEEKPFIEYKPIKIFIGLSPLNSMTEFGGGHGPKFDGNSILLQLTSDEYLFIGQCIYTFKSYADIVEYSSPVGNNDVPYPYAVDTNNNYYLLIEDIVINIPNKTDEPYEHYYAESKITYVGLNNTINKNFQNITNFYINNDEYTFRFELNATHEYNRLIKFDSDHEGDGKLYIVKTDGIKYELTRDEFIQIMDDYNKIMNCKKLLDKKIVHERM